MQETVLLPFAPILVESTRSIGYTFEAALADIIDNSIGKNATEIRVMYSSNSPQFVAVIDNACGMSSADLETAMRYGSKSSLEVREKDDLGRFGLGLKTASMSQCRKLTVISKQNGEINAASWDLDVIIKKCDWILLKYNAEEIVSLPFIEMLSAQESGTIVVWQEFDRILSGAVNPQKVFDEKIENARKHVALVFHRFMDKEGFRNRVNIYFNNALIEPVDPFLTSNPATQPLTEQTIRINGNVIKVKPYILPFASKVSARDKKKLGDLADLRQNQGFYIYRNRRLIIWGTWFRLLKQQELNKLARIRVDIPNTLDSIWEIDVKKSTASLPDIIKQNLIAIVKNSVGYSERVYRYRGRKTNNDNVEHVWNAVDVRGKIQYQINRDLPIYKILEASLEQKELAAFESFISMIEDSFPFGDVYYRLAKDNESIATSRLEFEEVYNVAVSMISNIKDTGMEIDTFLHNMPSIDFFAKYPDVIKKIREDYSNDNKPE